MGGLQTLVLMGAQSAPLFLFVKTIGKVNRLCTVVDFFLIGGCEGRPILRAFFGSKLSIYLQNYVKNGFIFKTVNQKKNFSTQCIILLLFLLFSQIEIGGAL